MDKGGGGDYVHKREGEGGSTYVIIFLYYLKCQNVDKGRGGGGSDNGDKDFCMFRPF